MGPTGGARNPVDARFLSLFHVYEVSAPSLQTQRAIFNTILDVQLVAFPADVRGIIHAPPPPPPHALGGPPQLPSSWYSQLIPVKIQMQACGITLQCMYSSPAASSAVMDSACHASSLACFFETKGDGASTCQLQGGVASRPSLPPHVEAALCKAPGLVSPARALLQQGPDYHEAHDATTPSLGCHKGTDAL